MRSIADQSEAELGGRFSVLRLQRRDHIRLDELLACLSEAAPLEQRKVLLHIYRLVFPHAFAEEAVLWPAIRRVVPNGDQLTVQVEREHQQINELVMLLETMEPDQPERPQLINEVVVLLGRDVGDEESALLPGLQAQLSTKELRALGVAWEVVRRIAPTRPHPFVSRRPPGNVLAALPLALLDRSRDAIDARRYDASGAATPTLDALSAELRRLSDWVERFPAFGLGEDLSAARKGHVRIKGVALLGGMAFAAVMMMTGVRRRAAEQTA